MVVIGIDLGTTYSCVAVYRNGVIEVIPNEHGNRATPSCVAFSGSERLIGESARNQGAVNPGNTIFGAKRLIGRRYDDVGLQMDLRHLPFKVLNENGKPMILVEYKGEKRKFTPEEISGMVLFKMKEIAETYLRTKVDQAVITVPAYFNDSQRQATRVAGMIAGLNVLKITNEPTAAALAYGLDRNLKDKNVLIYDLGGGAFDVSILSIHDSVYKVKSTAGNTRLGGEDFDNRLVAYFAEDFRKRFHIDITAETKALTRLKTAAERTKKFLTSANEATISIESLHESIDYHGRISRAIFEELCSDLFRDTLKLIQKVLTDAHLRNNDINCVILVGGSTRIPKVRIMLRELFQGVPITASVNPDEVVACGAAVQAAVLSKENHENIQEFLLIDVVPLSLGVETARGLMYKVIDKNTAIPCRKTKELTTLEDNQSSMTIEIFEGERSLTKDNNLLGVFDLNGIPPAPRGVAKIDVTFDVDSNGILNVTARDRVAGISKSITIRNDQRLKHDEVSNMIANAKAFKEEDVENKRRLEARNQLETHVFNVKQTINDNTEILTKEEKLFMAEQIEKALEWIDENTDCLGEEFEIKQTEFMCLWSGVMKKFYNPRWHQAKRQRTADFQALVETAG